MGLISYLKMMSKPASLSQYQVLAFFGPTLMANWGQISLHSPQLAHFLELTIATTSTWTAATGQMSMQAPHPAHLALFILAVNVAYLQIPMVLSVMSMLVCGSFWICSMALMQSTFSGMTSDSWCTAWKK